MFLEPAPSPFDLHFRLLGVPVRVHPMFWLFSAIFGWGYLRHGFGLLAMWVGAVFISILIHEMGHALMGMFFGRPAHVVLYSMGGLAVSQYPLPRRWQTIAVSFAGPGAGFLFYGLVFLFERFWEKFDPAGDQMWVWWLLHMLEFINLYWGLMNLLPVQPLDGGQICREVCLGISPEHGLRFSLGLSFLVGGLVAVYSLIGIYQPAVWFLPVNPTFAAILFGLLALQSYQMLMSLSYQRPHRPYDDDRPW